MYKFSYYTSNIKDAEPKGTVSLNYFLNAIRSPKEEILSIFEKIKIAHEAGDDAEKAKLKQSLYSFTPATICHTKRSYANISKFTGLLVLDFDKFQTNPDGFIDALKDFDIIHAAWKSASGYGVRALVKIPVVNTVDEYKAHFNYLRYNHDFGKVKQFDIAPQNPVLPLFLSYDSNIYVNFESRVMTSVFVPPPTIETKDTYYIDYGKSAGDEKDYYNFVVKALSKITDCGHPILRAVAYTLGGYVGAGRLMNGEAEAIIEKAIKEHSYLSKKASIYIRTAHEMISKGTHEPIYK